MSLTVCIVVYNEEKHLSLIEENIFMLRQRDRDMTLLLIDNASTDQTSSSLREIAKKHSANYILRSTNHLPQARNMAVEACRTDWIAFVDADCLIGEDWLSHVIQKTQEASNPTAAIGGPWKIAGVWKDDYAALFSTFLGNFGLVYLQPSFAHEKNVKHLPTANIVYRCKDVLAIGGFNSKNWRAGEDLDLSQRLIDSGRQILFSPSMKIKHYLPASFLSWFYKMFIYGQARSEVCWNHKSFSYVSCVPFFSFLFLIVLFIRAPIFFVELTTIYLLICMLVAAQSLPNAHFLRVFCLLVTTHFFYSLGTVYGVLKQMLQRVSEQRPFLSGHRGQEPGCV